MPQGTTGLKFVERVFAATSPETQRHIYDEWAATYERDVFGSGYRTPAYIAATFAQFVPRCTGPILDAGCGTGLQAEPLALLGYKPLIGIDISPSMLALAKSKGIYDELHDMLIDEHLPFKPDTFAAIISAGVLSPGQASASTLRAFARVTKPGSVCVFSLRGGDRTSSTYRQGLQRDGE